MKKSREILLWILCVIVVCVSVTATVMYVPRSLKNVVPAETDEIIKILKLSPYESFDPERLEGTEPALDEEYYDEFVALARSVKYVRFYNLRRLKCGPRFSVRYITYYENGDYIGLTTAFHHDENGTVRYSYLTNDPFPQIEALFEEHISNP